MKVKILNFSFSSPLKVDIPSLLLCRSLSGLSGTQSQQNPPQNYLIRPNSIHSVAFLGTKVVGYSIAQVWKTCTLFNLSWTKSYQNDLSGDTISITEIVVSKDQKGRNLGTELLKNSVGFRNELFGDRILQNMEMSILSTNLASERMFSKFCRDFGNSLTIGGVNESEMGNYIDWNIGLNGLNGSRSFVKVGSLFEFQPHLEKASLLKRSNVFFNNI